MNAYAVILCGGSGTRMGSKGNKTLLPAGGEPAVIQCLRAFQGLVRETVLVVRAGEESCFASVIASHHLPLPIIVAGGKDRQESAEKGVSALPEGEEAAVLIHDGARPYIRQDTIQRVIDSVNRFGSGVAAVPAKDTIKRVDQENRVIETPDRATLWQAQTPQGFLLSQLLHAYQHAPGRYTDDAALMEAMGCPVHLVMGAYDNLKLTVPEDLNMHNNGPLPRVGTGFDAHRLVENRELWLGGVLIPYEKGLLGHSDADAGLHALTDALLGAAALGDIGKLFPDKDPKYKDISSVILLKEAAKVLKEKGFVIGNVDLTLIAQAPKLAPYIPKMRTVIAEALSLPEARVSVKATTTEKMGFEGRGEGISAQAAALIFEAAE